MKNRTIKLNEQSLMNAFKKGIDEAQKDKIKAMTAKDDLLQVWEDGFISGLIEAQGIIGAKDIEFKLAGAGNKKVTITYQIMYPDEGIKNQ